MFFLYISFHDSFCWFHKVWTCFHSLFFVVCLNDSSFFYFYYCHHFDYCFTLRNRCWQILKVLSPKMNILWADYGDIRPDPISIIFFHVISFLFFSSFCFISLQWLCINSVAYRFPVLWYHKKTIMKSRNEPSFWRHFHVDPKKSQVHQNECSRHSWK